MAARPRLCLVAGQLGNGGLERQIYLLVTGLSKRPFDVSVVSMSRGGLWTTALRQAGVEVVELDRRGRMDWRRLAAMRRVFRTLRPDLVYSFNFETNAYARLAGLLAAVPILITGERGVYLSGMQTLLERILNPFTDCVICNAEAIRTDLIRRIGLPEHKVITVPNAVLVRPRSGPDDRVEARRQMGVGEQEILVGTVARLVEEKNLDLLVRLAWSLRDAPVRLRYVIVGTGPGEADLRSAIRRSGLEGDVTLLGEREDARALLPGFDIFVLTSRTEGLPNTVMEAMAASLPCVSTDVGGCGELVEHGVTGYLVPLEDERAMAGHLLDLALDAGKRTLMGQAGLRKISTSEYSVERVVENLQRVFQRLLESAPSRRRGRRLLPGWAGSR